MTLAVAHRGDPRRHRENTIPSLLSAIEWGADMVEIDLEVTRDGHLVLLHDATLRRLWWHNARVADLTLEQIRAVRRGRYRVPAFDEALALLPAHGARLMVDFAETALAAPAVEAVTRRGLLDQVLFVGSAGAMAAVREASPDARVGISARRAADLPPPGVIRDIAPDYLNLRHTGIDAAFVERAHADGHRVSTWTVDRPRRMARLAALGVDAIISNRISRLIDVLGTLPGAAAGGRPQR